jgi:antitoxin component YwqK of YwqJK toxin-antitoxin module
MEKRNGTGIIKKYYYDRIEEYYAYYEFFVFNGNKEGKYKQFYKNGQLYLICNYKNGKIEGEFQSYYESGQLYIKCNYKNNKIEGEW